jgi:hypothetical protein
MLDLMKKLNSGVSLATPSRARSYSHKEVPAQAPGPRATNTDLCQAMKEAACHFGQELRVKDGNPDCAYFPTEMIWASCPEPNLT